MNYGKQSQHTIKSPSLLLLPGAIIPGKEMQLQVDKDIELAKEAYPKR